MLSSEVPVWVEVGGFFLKRTPSSRLAEYALATRKGTADLWLQVRRQFLPALLVGILVGAAVTVIDVLAYGVLWGNVSRFLTPVTILLVPTIGLLVSGLLLEKTTVDPSIQGTEEYIEAYHEHGGVFSYRSVPGKVLAALATVGLGGSAGMEAPAIHLGSAIGSFVTGKLRRLGYSEDDVKKMAVAGAAAGVSAIFKAPLTGVIFALEVPYMDDMAHEALIPSLVGSVASYLVLVQFLGVEPLFKATERYVLSVPDLGYALLLGLIVGFVARLFVRSLHAAEKLAARIRIPLWARTATGGLVVGVLALIGLFLFGRPSVLGTGYEAIGRLVSGEAGGLESFEFLLLKVGATVATIGSGAAGGLFIPMIAMGAAAGSTLRGLVPGANGPLFPVAGMAAFLAAGYNAPIAAAVFVAESTGGAGYLIPGLVASVVAYTVAGRVSVSTRQRWRREDYVDRLMGLSVRDIMTSTVMTVPADTSVRTFLDEYVLKHRRKGFPVTDGEALTGFVSLSDVRDLSPDLRSTTPVSELMVSPVVTTLPDRPVGEVAALMSEGDLDRIPVVDPDDPAHLLGIISSTDILAFDKVFQRELG
jgi:CIC family chloride channel protein